MKKTPSNQLVCHISHTFWNIEQSAVRTCLEQYDGEWFTKEEEKYIKGKEYKFSNDCKNWYKEKLDRFDKSYNGYITDKMDYFTFIREVVSNKHPIELVNEKYPNGWCTDSFKEVIKQLNDLYDKEYNGHSFFYGVFKNKCWSDNIRWGIYLTKEEYLSITRHNEVEPTKKNLDIESKQRDWTGVRFKIVSIIDKTFEIIKSEGIVFKYHIIDNNGIKYVKHQQETVNEFFSNGTWIEIPAENEQPTIHAEKPNDLEARVKALEDRIINLEKRLNIL